MHQSYVQYIGPRCAVQRSSFVVVPGDMGTRLSHTQLKIEAAFALFIDEPKLKKKTRC